MAARRVTSRISTAVPKSFLWGSLFGVLLLLLLFGGRVLFSFSTDAISSVAVPAATKVARFFHTTRLWMVNISQIDDVAKTLRQLQHQVAQLEAENRQLRYHAEENKRLRALLGLSQSLKTPYQAAEVIAFGGSNWFRTVIINKGSDDGITENSPVINHQGVVGRIWKTYSHHSVVLLLTDRRSAIGITLNQHPDVFGIVRGTGNSYCELVHLSRNIIPKKGEQVWTSGLGGVFPKDLPVGEIEKVHRRTNPPTALVKPFMNEQDLHEVIVLSPSEPTVNIPVDVIEQKSRDSQRRR